MFHPSWVNDVRGRNCPIKGTHLNLPLLFSDRDFMPYVEHLGLVAA